MAELCPQTAYTIWMEFYDKLKNRFRLVSALLSHFKMVFRVHDQFREREVIGVLAHAPYLSCQKDITLKKWSLLGDVAETDLHRLVLHLRRVICNVAESWIPIKVPTHQQVPHLRREICSVAGSWIPFEVLSYQQDLP